MKSKHLVALLLSAALLIGCVSSGELDYYEIRENRIGLHRDKLIADIGEPSIQLHAPVLENDVEVMRYVYMKQVVASDCVDIYIVEKLSGNVVDYICQ